MQDLSIFSKQKEALFTRLFFFLNSLNRIWYLISTLKGESLRGAQPLSKIFPLPFTNPQGKGARGIGHHITKTPHLIPVSISTSIVTVSSLDTVIVIGKFAALSIP